MIRALVAMMVASVLTLTVAACAAPAELTRDAKARAAATSPIDRVRAELAQARAFAGLFTAFLPADQRRRLEALAAGVDAALAIADAATSPADHAAAVDQADKALDDYRFAAGA